jgi:hypothetical protein
MAGRHGIDAKALVRMERKPLYRFSEAEIGQYLGYIQEREPRLRKRIQSLARKMLGQKYRIFLLGEFPFEMFDPDPLYSLKESDCVVFAEHMYAMALAHDWSSFFCILQRIRYENGRIGLLTRNHYTELDWNPNNAWLVEDITEQLAGEDAREATSIVHKAGFFEKYGIGQDLPPDTLHWSYIPYESLPRVIDALQPGDFVNIVRGTGTGRYVGHVGLITRGESGTVNFLHSTHPRVIEQPLLDLYRDAEAYNADRRRLNIEITVKNEARRNHNRRVEELGRGRKKRLLSPKPCFYGFKFLRLREDPLTELIRRFGPDALDIEIPMKW